MALIAEPILIGVKAVFQEFWGNAEDLRKVVQELVIPMSLGLITIRLSALFLYHMKNKPPAMPVSPQIALATSKTSYAIINVGLATA